jgi:SpoVK/Ycf46/Vps4 family AAA+-type ATPase
LTGKAAAKKGTAKGRATTGRALDRYVRGRSRQDAAFPTQPPRAELPSDYLGTLADIKRRIQQERLRVVVAANAAMVVPADQRRLGRQGDRPAVLRSARRQPCANHLKIPNSSNPSSGRTPRCLLHSGRNAPRFLDLNDHISMRKCFLQFLEQEESESIVLAATNHVGLLDRALIRRFDDIIEFTLPDADLAIGAMKARLAAIRTAGVNWGSG